LPYPLKVVPPLHVAQIERGMSAANGAGGLKRRSGSRQVTGSQCEVSDSHVADGQVVLPAGVARVGVTTLLILAEHDSRKGLDGRQVAGVQQSIDLQVSDHGPRALGLGMSTKSSASLDSWRRVSTSGSPAGSVQGGR
jgi:hypothetical protein